jgi:hypothetical protein
LTESKLLKLRRRGWIPIASKFTHGDYVPLKMGNPSTPVEETAHAPKGEQSDAPAKKSFMSRLLGRFKDRRFLFISILVHVLFAMVAVYLVVQTITPKRKLTFKGGPPSPNPSQRAMQHEVKMAQKQKTMSAPAPAKRITTTSMSKVALPEMPAMPTTDNSPMSKMAGMTPGGLGMTMGGGSGGSSGGGGGGVPFFGMRNGRGLAGTFIDFKQTKDRKATEIGKDPGKVPYHDLAYEAVVKRFVSGGFQPSTVENFFQSPSPIYTQQVFVPGIMAADGPKAFGLEKQVQPSRWVVVYRGKVRAPDTGTYRFVGWADDVLVVRFNRNIVLDGSFANVSSWKRRKVYNYNFPHKGFAYAGFVEGDPVSVTKGLVYDVEILIGESPGGHFYAQLLMEKQGENYQKDGAGNPILPIFRVADVQPPDVSKSLGSVPVAPNGPIWPVVQDTGSMLGLP